MSREPALVRALLALKAHAGDQEQKNALAAAGYFRAYRLVRTCVEEILNGRDAGAVIASQLESWHRELFMPSVEAGLFKSSDLLGYRRGQVYIAGSRYTPPSASRLVEAMDAYFDLVRKEPDYRVRAILGHFFLVHIHPYSDGNGRLARFVMNVSLVAGGGLWTVIPVAKRERYMQSLETASVEGRIEDFVEVVVK